MFKLDYSRNKRMIETGFFFLVPGVIITLVMLFISLKMPRVPAGRIFGIFDFGDIIGFFMGFMFTLVGLFLSVGPIKESKEMKYLAKNGKLIKGLPYQLESTNTTVNGHRLMKIIASYTDSNGLTKEYKSRARAIYASYNYVDLLIDPNNPENFYIDFDIQYTGNPQVEIVNSNIYKEETPRSRYENISQAELTNIVHQNAMEHSETNGQESVKQVIELPTEEVDTNKTIEAPVVSQDIEVLEPVVQQANVVDNLPIITNQQAIINPNYQQNNDTNINN